MTTRIVLSVITNIVSYSVVFPFVGAFIMLLFYSVIEDGPIGVVVAAALAPTCGLLAVIMFWIFGIAAAVLPSLFIINMHFSLICNILCSTALTWLIHNFLGDAFSNYATAMYLVSVCHALVLTRITQSILGNHSPLFKARPPA